MPTAIRTGTSASVLPNGVGNLKKSSALADVDGTGFCVLLPLELGDARLQGLDFSILAVAPLDEAPDLLARRIQRAPDEIFDRAE